VENICQEGGGVVFDRDHGSDWREGVSELEEELGRFRQVIDGGGLSLEGAAPAEGRLVG
jgi:hypothetical protein